jgi:hypothetical protein
MLPAFDPDFDALCEAISAGDCIAFVGAGFSAGVVGGWRHLLADVAEHEPLGSEALRRAVLRLLEGPSVPNHDLEAAAQLLADALGHDGMAQALKARAGSPALDQQIKDRLAWLRGIPFRSILTTNFDGILAGRIPGPDAYLSVLRPGDNRWWDAQYWQGRDAGPPVIKLHGDLLAEPPEVVLTRRDYRRRLYGSPAYTTFLKSLFATSTVLYLGFSFTDAYLNELRSEILALVDYHTGDRPLAYAVVSDVSDEQRRYLREHEGIAVFTYPGGGRHEGFDEYLQEMHRRTNPAAQLGRAIAGKRILWVDPNDYSSDVEHGMRLLEEAARLAGGRTAIAQVPTAEEGFATLAERGWDLLITHWGYGQAPAPFQSVGERVLTHVRRSGLPVPAVVFASGQHADENKVEALRLGAVGYAFRWESLFRLLADLFAPGSQTG